jgi:hypothetical protein
MQQTASMSARRPRVAALPSALKPALMTVLASVREA